MIYVIVGDLNGMACRKFCKALAPYLFVPQGTPIMQMAAITQRVQQEADAPTGHPLIVGVSPYRILAADLRQGSSNATMPPLLAHTDAGLTLEALKRSGAQAVVFYPVKGAEGARVVRTEIAMDPCTVMGTTYQGTDENGYGTDLEQKLFPLSKMIAENPVRFHVSKADPDIYVSTDERPGGRRRLGTVLENGDFVELEIEGSVHAFVEGRGVGPLKYVRYSNGMTNLTE